MLYAEYIDQVDIGKTAQQIKEETGVRQRYSLLLIMFIIVIDWVMTNTK